MDESDATYYKQRRENAGTVSIGTVFTAFSLLIAVAALSLSGYYGVKLTQLQEEQLVMHTELKGFSYEGASVHNRSKRSTDLGIQTRTLGERHDSTPTLRGPPGRDGRDGRDAREGRGCGSGNCQAISGPCNKDDTDSGSSGSGSESGSDSGSGSNVGLVGGSTYVRWGRTTCGEDSELIYEGFAAGQHYSQSGGAANYECLPLEPEYSKVNPGVGLGTLIYGAEYEHSGTIFPSGTNDQNVPCARCYAPHRSAKMMIPAKRSCPSSWTKEYEGYLMTGYHGHKRAYTYACMDANPEYVAGRPGNENGALFYFVQASCVSTGHCPPYVEGSELTCVVCSK